MNLRGCRRRRGFHASYEAIPDWRPSATHGADHDKRDLNLKISGKHGIKDFGNGQGYSPINLVMVARGCSRAEAVAWLQERVEPNDKVEVDWDSILSESPGIQPEDTTEHGANRQEEATREDNQEKPKQDAGTRDRKRRFYLVPFTPVNPIDIPPRKWLLHRHYQRRVVSADIADGGVGKSSLNLVEAIIMATGRPLLGEAPEEDGLRVWVHNGEDDMDEMNRRVAAICQHYEVPQEDLKGRLFLTTGSEIPLKVAKGYNELQIDDRLIRDIVDNIMDNKVDVAMYDPLISLHGTKEGDNDKMDQVVRIFVDRIARPTNSSGNISHHTRKPPAGSSGSDRDGDDGRGASAVRDAVRGMRVLNPMSAADAAKIGINELQRTSHFRVDRGKANYAKPADSAIWRKFESVILPNGDDVGVVTPWQFPDEGSLDFTDGAQEDNLLFLAILDRFAAQGRWVNPTSGANYAPHAFAKEPEAKAAGATKHRLVAAMRRLFAAKHIRVEDYRLANSRGASRIVRATQ